MAKPDHSERTADEPRDPSLHSVILRRIEEINPSIRTFRLAIPPSVGSIKVSLPKPALAQTPRWKTSPLAISKKLSAPRLTKPHCTPATCTPKGHWAQLTDPPPHPVQFLPGQWLDVFVPGISKPGGFTITSAPSRAQKPPPPSSSSSNNNTTTAGAAANDDGAALEPYLELAVQKSPDNPAAKYLWRPKGEILSSELRVRVGGSFVWPPPGVQPMTLRKIVFVAGGVGINPLMSIASHLAERPGPRHTVEFLYSTRDPGEGRRDAKEILFLNRLAGIFNGGDGANTVRGGLSLFLTPGGGDKKDGPEGASGQIMGISFKQRRITIEDVAEAVGDDKRFAVVYVCGVPAMTDEFVEKLTSPEGLGLEPHRVLYEKWW
ncbi:hypothetical protein diail_454 [Diaporthe ilicicola]|nr:hypothetical protein diail_454 [Diaporthe ilicicola]